MYQIHKYVMIAVMKLCSSSIVICRILVMQFVIKFTTNVLDSMFYCWICLTNVQSLQRFEGTLLVFYLTCSDFHFFRYPDISF